MSDEFVYASCLLHYLHQTVLLTAEFVILFGYRLQHLWQ
jgi:hypothetical protein